MSLTGVRLSRMVVLVTVMCMPAIAIAQTIEPAQTALDPNPGKVSLAATYDFTNAYMFRGLLQDDTRLIMFPFAEARIDLHTDPDIALRIGSWNSLNTGVTGTQ